MQNNKVFLSADGIIEIEVAGDQSADSVTAMGEKIKSLCASQRAERRPVLLLDSVLGMGRVPGEARTIVVNLGKHLDYDRLAMLGKGGMLRIGANLILGAMGKGAKVQYFDNREQALGWLKQPLPAGAR